MADAYPMYEKCVQHQQKYGHVISDLIEPAHISGMLMLDSGERQVTIMQIKYATDDMVEHAKKVMDRMVLDTEGNPAGEQYAGG